jgi:beta-glucosidase
MEKQMTNSAAAKQKDILDYKSPNLSITDRVNDLLNQMTLEEKVTQLQCIWDLKNELLLDENKQIDINKLQQNLKNGLGQIARLSDTGEGLNDEGRGRTPKEMVEVANTIQQFLTEKTRLGIPVIFHEECLHGLAALESTSYPQPIGLAATFNLELIEEIFSRIAEETRKRGAHQVLAPVVDVARDPRWGRVEETFGEDPYLVSHLGIVAVKGLQGDGDFKDKKKVIATLKHFAGHGQPESGSNAGPANYSERILKEVFLFPFKEVIQKGKVKCVMPSYNEIDGVPSHANKWLLRDVLRQEWGFDGFTVSDYYAITELYSRDETTSHYIAQNKKAAAVLAVKAGVNIEFPDSDCYTNLVELVDQGKIEDADIDNLVASVLKYKFAMGLFEDPYVDPALLDIESELESNRKIALQAARETITLLKNDNQLLPLDKSKIKNLAVIGPNADRILLGGYSGVPKYNTTVLQGIKEKVGNNVNVLYSEGCKITVGGSWVEDTVTLPDPAEDSKAIEDAVVVANKADVVVLVIGGNEQTSREAFSKDHMGDRTSLELFGKQNELVAAIIKTGKPVLVILFNGRPNSFSFVAENVPTILECWYLGQENGHAVADVLFGDFNPGGKLPMSIPRSVGHLPCFYNHKPSARRGYLFDETSALFPFGYGLSYTNFSFSNLRLEKSTINSNESTQALIDVKNIGNRTGTEVVQLYIRDVISSVTRPVKELKGFEKITLEPGKSKTVELEIKPEHLAFYDIDMNYVVEAGEFEIMVGNSSRDEDLQKIILQVT